MRVRVCLSYMQDGAHIAGRQVVLFGRPVQVNVQASHFILTGLAGHHGDHLFPRHPITWARGGQN